MKPLFTCFAFHILIITGLFAQNSFEAVTPAGDTIQISPNKTWKFKIRAATDIYDIDSNRYKTVLIGEQVWMAENLKTTRFKDGTPIPNIKPIPQWRAFITPAYSAYNNDSTLKKDTACYITGML